MLAIYTITIFLGAAMLFLVQPMVAKAVLPLFGGSPSVWNTCMVFFQGLLLAGYVYAHVLVRMLGPRRQVAIHLAVVSVPLVLWAVGNPPLSRPGEAMGRGEYPAWWLLVMLMACVGPAFFVLSTCGTLMQRWFAGTGHAAARDPYFLYAASNAGSMLALLAYPLLVEPWLSVSVQRHAWSLAYGVFVIATAVCGVYAMRHAGNAAIVVAAAPSPSARQCVMWVVLAMIPSSLLLAVTQHLSTDIAAIPLLWVVPLALYLLTFILAFSRGLGVPVRVSDRTLPVLVTSLATIALLGRHDPIWIIVTLNLATLFFGAALCHGRLAASRPAPSHLTVFYLCIAFGGAMGGLFNAVAAPVLFDSLLEYPIVLAAVCLMRPAARPASTVKRLIDVGFAMIPAGLMVTAMMLVPLGWTDEPSGEFAKHALVIGIPVVVSYLLVGWPVRFAVGIGVLLLVDAGLTSRQALTEVRTFFGLYTVYRTESTQGRGVVELRHGTTLHGSQWVDPAERNEPLVYYHRRGPIGDVFAAYGGTPLFDCVALVGLGTGSIAAYGRAGQELRIFEIDEAVVRLAGKGGYFNYLGDSPAKCSVTLGDARRSLALEAEGSFGAIVLDAFNSDAVPVHLLTREAVALYASRLKPGGLIVFHVSNRYLELERVVAGVTRELGMVAAIRDDVVEEEESRRTLRWGSTWIVAARSRGDLAPVLQFRGWHELRAGVQDRVWTDDFSSFVGIFRWGGEE